MTLSTELHETTTRINSNIEEVRKNAEAEMYQAEADKDEQQDKNEARLRAIDKIHNEKLTDLQQQARPIELAIEMITHKVLSSDEQAYKDQLDNELTQANSQSSQWHTELKPLQTTIDDVKEKIQKQEREARHHEQLAEKIKSKIKTLEKQLNPDSGSLLSFLKSSAPQETTNWQRDIAKVINPELIHRTDLNPQWQAELSSEIYGLALNIEAIEIPEFAQNDLELRERIDAHVIELTEIEQRLQDISQVAITLRREDRSLTAQKTSLDNKISHNDEKIDAIKSRQLDFEKTCISNRQQRLIEQKSKLSEHQLQVHSLKDKQTKERQQVVIENRNRLNVFKDVVASIKQRRDDNIKEKQKLIEDAQKNKSQQESLLERSYQQALKKEGVDTETLNQVKKEIKHLDARYKTTKAYEGLVEKYERWLKVEWIEASNYQARINDLTDKLIALEDAISAQELIQSQALAEKNNELTQISTRLSNLETQASSVIDWKNKARPYTSYLKELETVYRQAKLAEQLPALAQTQPHPTLNSDASNTSDLNSSTRFSTLALNLDSDDVPWLISINKLIPECQKALDKIKRTASVLHNNMTQHLGSQVHQAWQNRQNQYRYQRLITSANTNSGHEQENDTQVLSPEVIALLDVMSLQMVVNEDLVQLEKIIHSSFITIGLDICNYYSSLNNIKNKISTIGKRL